MNNEDKKAVDFLRSMVDEAVRRGMFENAASVVVMTNSLQRVETRLAELPDGQPVGSE